jgi:hypothetical protein
MKIVARDRHRYSEIRRIEESGGQRVSCWSQDAGYCGGGLEIGMLNRVGRYCARSARERPMSKWEVRSARKLRLEIRLHISNSRKLPFFGAFTWALVVAIVDWPLLSRTRPYCTEGVRDVPSKRQTMTKPIL